MTRGTHDLPVWATTQTANANLIRIDKEMREPMSFNQWRAGQDAAMQLAKLCAERRHNSQASRPWRS